MAAAPFTNSLTANPSSPCSPTACLATALYIFDEPEAALSPMRQMSMLVLMKGLVNNGAQFIIATHSPILLAYPDALIYQITDSGLEAIPYTETEHYRVNSRFPKSPRKNARPPPGRTSLKIRIIHRQRKTKEFKVRRTTIPGYTIRLWIILSRSSAAPTWASRPCLIASPDAISPSSSTAPGTTRDRMVTTARWDKHRFTLIDTGGIGVDDKEGFGNEIAHEVELALAAATEIIFVVDAREGLTPLDLTVARLLRKSHCPVYVAANKVDGEKQANLDGEFQRLGFKGVFPVSAAHRRGLEQLRSAITKGWAEPAEEIPREERPARPTRLAIVGRPNVGKSSLINTLMAEPPRHRQPHLRHHPRRPSISPTPGATSPSSSSTPPACARNAASVTSSSAR